MGRSLWYGNRRNASTPPFVLKDYPKFLIPENVPGSPWKNLLPLPLLSRWENVLREHWLIILDSCLNCDSYDLMIHMIWQKGHSGGNSLIRITKTYIGIEQIETLDMFNYRGFLFDAKFILRSVAPTNEFPSEWPISIYQSLTTIYSILRTQYSLLNFHRLTSLQLLLHDHFTGSIFQADIKVCVLSVGMIKTIGLSSSSGR